MKNNIKITFLGTGTSLGVPVITCECKVCKSTDPRDNRLRSSVIIMVEGKNILIDTGPDFRQQMLQNNIKQIDAILYTHEHKDHVAGLDDVRPFNFVYKKPIPVFVEPRVNDALKREYAYIFESNYPGIPKIDVNLISNKSFKIDNLEIIPIRIFHNELPILGYRIKDFAYLTDVKHIPEIEFSKLSKIDTLVISTLRKEEHPSHLNLKEALDLIEKIRPKRSYLTHLSHRFGLHAEESIQLPKNVFIAYDGLSISNGDNPTT
jgi:phosphoribosyl 1,2-cyclic phosphate phosphodiesterase